MSDTPSHREYIEAAIESFASEAEGLTLAPDVWNNMRVAIRALLSESGPRLHPGSVLTAIGAERHIAPSAEGRMK